MIRDRGLYLMDDDLALGLVGTRIGALLTAVGGGGGGGWQHQFPMLQNYVCLGIGRGPWFVLTWRVLRAWSKVWGCCWPLGCPPPASSTTRFESPGTNCALPSDDLIPAEAPQTRRESFHQRHSHNS